MPPEQTDNVVETLELTKVFRDFWHRPRVRAVDHLDLQVRRGEVFGLLGPNGSGKSTTLKLLLGLLFPTSGYIRILGRPPRDVRVKSRLGFLPEETYLYPYLNAVETLDFFGRLSKIPRADRRRRVDALIDMVGLTAARHRPLHEYSKGMARRIGLAQALINDPELILLDEPTAGLDPIGTQEVKNLVRELRTRGKSILMCSHLLADVQDVCDRIGILYAGRLWTAGEVDSLLMQKQRTQITTPTLSPEAQQRVEAVLHEVTGGEEIEVGHPRDRLEDFFLRVVEQARQAQPVSAGAGVGRFDASLFEAEPAAKPEDVIDRLTTPAAQPEPQPEPVEPAEPEPPPEPGVLESLTTAPPQPSEQETRAQADAEARQQAEAEEVERRSVLDRLVQQPRRDPRDDEPS